MQHFLNYAFIAAQYFVNTDFCLSSSSPRFMFELPTVKNTGYFQLKTYLIYVPVYLKLTHWDHWIENWEHCFTSPRPPFQHGLMNHAKVPSQFPGQRHNPLAQLYFKNPGIGLALGIKAATYRSAVQRSTNGVNSAWVKRKLPYYRLFHPNLVPRASLYPIFWSARVWDSNNKEPGQPVLIVVPNTAFIVTVHEYLVASFFWSSKL